MHAVPHGPRVDHERPSRPVLREVPELWASLAITVMWIAVFVTAIWGPDAHFAGADGSSSTVPVAAFVTVFAFLGTWIVARHGLRRREEEQE
jgi:membrane protein YdbS with pleckstrin-like domain